MARTSQSLSTRPAPGWLLGSSVLLGGFLLWLGLPPVVVAAPLGIALGVIFARKVY